MKYLETYAKRFAQKFQKKWNSDTPVEIMLPNYLDEVEENKRKQKEFDEETQRMEDEEEEVSEKKMNESAEIMLGDNKIHEVKEGDQLRFMEHYKNHLIKKYSSSFTDEINLDEPVTFVRVESSNLIRPNLIVRTKEGVEWVFGPEAFVLDRL